MSEERKPKELNGNELKSVSGGVVYPTVFPTPRPPISDGKTRIWAKCNNCGCEFIWREICAGVVTFGHENCTNCGSDDFTETSRLGG